MNRDADHPSSLGGRRRATSPVRTRTTQRQHWSCLWKACSTGAATRTRPMPSWNKSSRPDRRSLDRRRARRVPRLAPAVAGRFRQLPQALAAPADRAVRARHARGCAYASSPCLMPSTSPCRTFAARPRPNDAVQGSRADRLASSQTSSPERASSGSTPRGSLRPDACTTPSATCRRPLQPAAGTTPRTPRPRAREVAPSARRA